MKGEVAMTISTGTLQGWVDKAQQDLDPQGRYGIDGKNYKGIAEQNYDLVRDKEFDNLSVCLERT